MKTLFTAEATSKGGRSGTIHNPEGLLDVTLGNPFEKGAEKRGPSPELLFTGTSTQSVEDAVDNAIKRAHKTLKNLSWFQVVETRGNIDRGRVRHWQVTLKIGFAIED